MRLLSWTSLFLVPLSVFVETAAWAQEAPAAPAPSGPAAAVPMPDVVRLKNGSMVRGLITELLVGDHVDIRIASGETRHVPMQDVDYAGPDPAQTSAPPKAQPASPEGNVEVRVTANEPGVDLQIVTGQSEIAAIAWGARGTFPIAATARSYKLVCTAPCTTWLPKGSHRFGLSIDGGATIPVEKTIALEGATRLETEYTSRSGVRAAGWVIFVAGVAAGSTMIYLGLDQKETACNATGTGCSENPTLNPALLALGTVILSGGTLIGLLMAMTSDSVDIRAAPQPSGGQLQIAPTFLAPRYESASRSGTSPLDGAGLVARYRF